MNQRSSTRKAQSKGKKLQTKALQEETRRMEQKLEQLKKQMEVQRSQQRDQKSQTGSRWKQSQANAPLRGYATKVIQDQKTAFKKHGITPSMMATNKTIFGSAKDPKSETKMTIDIVMPSQEVVQEQPIFYDLASKFGKAKVVTQKLVVQDSVGKLLESIGLLQYGQVFERNYVDDIELITRQGLEDMGIPPGHRIKILKRVSELKEEGTQKPIEISNAEKLVQKQTLIEPQVSSQQQQQQSTQRCQLNIFDGQYDQQKNARQFQQAVLAFRNINQQIHQIQIALQTQTPQSLTLPVPFKNKFACFSCYRSFITQQPFTMNDRHFCTERCLERYRLSMEEKCTKCGKVFNKLEGFSCEGIRYCRVECSPEIRKMEELFVKWKMEQRQKKGQSQRQSN